MSKTREQLEQELVAKCSHIEELDGLMKQKDEAYAEKVKTLAEERGKVARYAELIGAAGNEDQRTQHQDAQDARKEMLRLIEPLHALAYGLEAMTQNLVERANEAITQARK